MQQARRKAHSLILQKRDVPSLALTLFVFSQTRAKKLAKEVNNGRLAMLGAFVVLFAIRGPSIGRSFRSALLL